MNPKTTQLLQLIAEKSALAQGFSTADAKAMHAEKNAAKLCRQQVEDGTLFKARANKSAFAYFQTQAMAHAYMQRNLDALLAKRSSNITFAPKAAKACRAVEIVRPAHVKTQVYLSPPPRNQIAPLPAFIHGGMGAMRA